jgi:hypothetical protein
VQLTLTFTQEQYARALESWMWIGLDGKIPRFTSMFGDVFFEADDGWWFLNSLDGTLERRWSTLDELKAVLATEDGADEFLLAGLAMGAAERGPARAEGQIWDFVPPPILGGDITVDNLQAIDFVVALHIGGQLHDQVRSMPPGTQISGVRIADDEPPPPKRGLFGRRKRAGQ